VVASAVFSTVCSSDSSAEKSKTHQEVLDSILRLAERRDQIFHHSTLIPA
jgi:hypothetical protein